MGVMNQPKEIYSAAGNNGGGEVYTPAITCKPGEFIGIRIHHPASTTTTYRVDGSDTPEDQCGPPPTYTNAVWSDEDVRDADNVALAGAALSSATVKKVNFRSTSHKLRVAINTATGTGNIRVEIFREGA